MLMLRLSFSTGKIFVKLFVDFEPRAEPDLEFEGLLKRQHTRVKYFQGSLMNAMDLERAKVSQKKHVFHAILKEHLFRVVPPWWDKKSFNILHSRFMKLTPVLCWPTSTARTRTQKTLPTS